MPWHRGLGGGRLTRTFSTSGVLADLHQAGDLKRRDAETNDVDPFKSIYLVAGGLLHVKARQGEDRRARPRDGSRAKGQRGEGGEPALGKGGNARSISSPPPLCKMRDVRGPPER